MFVMAHWSPVRATLLFFRYPYSAKAMVISPIAKRQTYKNNRSVFMIDAMTGVIESPGTMKDSATDDESENRAVSGWRSCWTLAVYINGRKWYNHLCPNGRFCFM